jgi:hypothetical protein
VGVGFGIFVARRAQFVEGGVAQFGSVVLVKVVARRATFVQGSVHILSGEIAPVMTLDARLEIGFPAEHVFVPGVG